jgi:nucleotide-binding universal stress UspA family protein
MESKQEVPMTKIILCFDNSDNSFIAAEASRDLARAFGSEVVGIHGYNAFMHEGAFKIMEPTLPQQYQKEEILQKQRDVHTTLINVGMEKISLSYLNPLEESFQSAQVSFRAKVKEGKNFKSVSDLINDEGGDLVVLGCSGFNSNGNGFIGSVCLRVLRAHDRNFLVIKKPLALHNNRTFVVGLDGSSSATSALRAARLFAEKFGAEVHLIYVFDSKLHRDIFERLKESVINREGFAFNTKEQEKIHDEFIDKGLARVGSLILHKAEREIFGETSGEALSTHGWGLVGERRDIPRIKRVLEGHIYKRICDYASEVNADMIFVGRTGRHFVDGMDLGSVTENVVRFSSCNVFISQQEDYKGWEL